MAAAQGVRCRHGQRATMPFSEVEIRALDLRRFRDLVGDEWGEVAEAISEAPKVLEGRVVWHINSTARGGGVAELLRSLLAYARGAGVDSRWIAIGGGREFFAVTKRLHHRLHGFPGDGGGLGEPERRIYESTLAEVATELAGKVRSSDIVFIHDPQPAGLVPAILETGAPVVWRCHIGLDRPNDLAREAWDFLRPCITPADGLIFSRPGYVWEGIDPDRVTIIHPSIDVFSPKNQEMSVEQADAILSEIGLLADPQGRAPTFVREDGTPGRIEHPAEYIQEQPIAPGTLTVTQVSRWDTLKDPTGVIRCFAEHIDHRDAHLVLAGPAPGTVSDDPEALGVLDSTWAARDELERGIRNRIHLVVLPMEDAEENAAMVNALQGRSTVVVQKSLAEGFGLTVAEAMWKGRPVVASAVGGIQDQIVDGVSGILVEDPADLAGFGEAISGLLADPPRADALGAAAKERVRKEFLGPAHLLRYLSLIQRLDAARSP